MTKLIAQIIASYQAGQSIRAIAAANGCTHEGIRQILIRHGIPRRAGGITTRDDRERIVIAYLAGQSIRAIATAERLSAGLVHGVLHNAGVAMRPPGRRPTRPCPTTTEDTDQP